MPLEEFTLILSALRKKLFYIAAVFGAGTIFSFPLMGSIIKKIQNDMFFGLNLPEKPAASAQLIDISHNLSLISKELAANNSIIAQNLTVMSGDLINISQNLTAFRPAIVYLTPLEVLVLEFKMSLLAGVFLALPLVSYYAYRGLKGRLRNILPLNKYSIVGIFIASVVLFLLGAGYAYYYMLPFFLSYIYKDAMSIGVNANFSVSEFVNFIAMSTLIMGMAFELPLVMSLLVRLGVTSRDVLARYRKHAYIVLLVIAAIITPDPTMFSQVMVAVPFIVLYEVSLLAMRVAGK